MPQTLTDIDREAELDAPLPERPRRRGMTPVMLVLGAIVVAGLGFTGGVLVQKGQGGSSGGSGTARAGGFPGAAAGGRQAAGGAAGGGQAQQQGTSGTVSSAKGSTLYVKGSDGTTVKVKVGGSATVTRNAGSSARGIHPGDTVVVQGATAKNGTVTATSVTATADGVQSSGGFGGFQPPTGAAPSAGGGG